jgi:hypothetical protein
MENGPFSLLFYLLKMVIFQFAMLNYQSVTIVTSTINHNSMITSFNNVLLVKIEGPVW